MLEKEIKKENHSLFQLVLKENILERSQKDFPIQKITPNISSSPGTGSKCDFLLTSSSNTLHEKSYKQKRIAQCLLYSHLTFSSQSQHSQSPASASHYLLTIKHKEHYSSEMKRLEHQPSLVFSVSGRQ